MTPFQIIATHPDGWSAPATIAAGQDDVTIALVIARPGAVDGRMTTPAPEQRITILLR